MVFKSSSFSNKSYTRRGPTWGHLQKKSHKFGIRIWNSVNIQMPLLGLKRVKVPHPRTRIWCTELNKLFMLRKHQMDIATQRTFGWEQQLSGPWLPVLSVIWWVKEDWGQSWGSNSRPSAWHWKGGCESKECDWGQYQRGISEIYTNRWGRKWGSRLTAIWNNAKFIYFYTNFVNSLVQQMIDFLWSHYIQPYLSWLVDN